MKSRDLIFLLIIATVVGGLYYLSTKNKAHPMPSDPPEHLSVTDREDCLKCHLPEKMGQLEIEHKHPGKWRDKRVSCLLCHTQPKGAAGVNRQTNNEQQQEKEK
ncbi:MAG: hypothetical protein EBZ36_10590 [Acidobacteria bacterium]|nr:hypothetical protein [Acidobacteriota bacterium]